MVQQRLFTPAASLFLMNRWLMSMKPDHSGPVENMGRVFSHAAICVTAVTITQSEHVINATTSGIGTTCAKDIGLSKYGGDGAPNSFKNPLRNPSV
jgi:hypothetical protein